MREPSWEGSTGAGHEWSPAESVDVRGGRDDRGACSGRGFVEILVYTTPAGRLVIDVGGSGMPHLTRSFRSGAELGEFVSALLAGGSLIRHPVLSALRDAADHLPEPRMNAD